MVMAAPSTIAQRIRAAARAAVGIFSEGSARQAYGLLGGLWPAGSGAPPTQGARERVAAYADMPWLHALADKVASAFAAVEWTLAYPRGRRDRRAFRAKSLQRAPSRADRAARAKRLEPEAEMVEVREHPLLDLLDGGNAMMTGLGMRKVTALHWDLEGEAFWLKERNGVGAPVAAWPLPPDWVRATPTPATPAYRVGFRGWQGTVPDTEVLWLPNHNPSNPYGRGTGIARALADELEVDEYAAKMVRQQFFNQARPDFIVYPGEDAGSWSDAERLRLQQDWGEQHDGFWRAFKPRFASRKLGVFEFAQADNRSLQMVQLREFNADLIRKIWGVPPEIMGIVEPGASRATAKLASYIFARWVLVPRLEMFRALLQERLVPEYDERLILDYVSPVEEDGDFALEVARANPTALDLDEWRALANRPEMANGQGKRWAVPAGVTLVSDLADAAPPPPLVLPPPAEPTPEPEESEEMRVMRRFEANLTAGLAAARAEE